MPQLDLYSIYALDRRQPSEQLAAALTAQLNSADPRDQLTRSRIETARAILGDPQRRAAYDRQLDDPQAPPITETTLAALAGRPVPTGPRSGGLAAAFASRQVQVLAGVAGLLVVVLVIVIVAVTSGGSDGGSAPTAESAGAGRATTRTGKSADCTQTYLTDSTTALPDYMSWSSGPRPSEVLVLTAQYDLPSQFAPLSTAAVDNPNGVMQAVTAKLTQFQDKTVGVQITSQNPAATRNSELRTQTYLAVVNQDGAVAKTYGPVGLDDSSLPRSFDLARRATSGYYRVEAADGVQIPSAADGDAKHKEFVISALPDAFDHHIVWMLMRGSNKLYKANFYKAPTVDEVAPIIGSCSH